MNVTPKDLLDAGVHFGHQTKRWNPRSKPFVFDHRQGISIIDLGKTHAALEKATKFVEETVANGGNILFVGTKRQAKEIIREAASATNMPVCVDRWLGPPNRSSGFNRCVAAALSCGRSRPDSKTRGPCR